MRVLISLEIDGLPPTVNQMYRTGRYSARYKRTDTLKYQKYVTELLRSRWGKVPPYVLPIELRIILTACDHRKWDIDNRVKALQDCLSKAGIIADDSQVEILHVERNYGKKAATYIEVRVNDRTARISD